MGLPLSAEESRKAAVLRLSEKIHVDGLLNENYSFTPFVTLSNFVQYDTDSRDIGLQSRLRWIMKPGREFFVVFNHNWRENDLNRFESSQTHFRIKLNYTFRI